MPTFRTGRPDGRSNAQVVADLVAERQQGDPLTYETLAEALAYEDWVPSREAIQHAKKEADEKLLPAMGRKLEAVRNVGYTILFAGQHVRSARAQERKARNALRRGRSTLERTNLAELTDAQRETHLEEQRRSGVLVGLLDRAEQRHRAIESISRL